MRSVFRLSPVALVVVGGLPWGPLWAQSAQGVLPEVVVSVSRSEQAPEDVAATVQLQSRATMDDRQTLDIRDAAQELPNIEVKRAPARYFVTGHGSTTSAVGADGNAGFSIRGLGGNRVLMLEDGLRLPRSYANGNVAFGRDTLALDQAGRLEIIPSAGSALYGSDALAGVVQSLTLSPADLLRNADGSLRSLGARSWAAYSGDDRGLHLGLAAAGQASSSSQWLFSASVGRAHELDNQGTVDAANESRTTPNPQTLRDQNLLAKWVWQPLAGQTHTFTAQQVRRSASVDLLSGGRIAPVALTASNFTNASARARTTALGNAITGEDADYDLTRNRLSWHARWALGAAAADVLTATVGWQDSRARHSGTTHLASTGSIQNVRWRDTDYTERTWQANAQAEKQWTLGAEWAHKLTYGIDWVQTDVSSLTLGSDPAPLVFNPIRYFPDTRDAARAVYVQSEWFNERWSITPGVRWDRFDLSVLRQAGYYPPAPAPGQSLSGSAVSPKLGVVFKATPQASVYGQWSRGFRAPEGQQLNSTLDNATLAIQLLPNPDLQPERSRTLELGGKWRSPTLQLDVAVFHSRYDQLIQEKVNLGTVGGVTQFQTVNIDRATIHGWEFKGLWQLGSWMDARWSLPFAYGHARGSNDTTGKPLNAISPDQFSLGLQRQGAQWDWGLTWVRRSGKSAGDLDSPYIPKSTTLLQFLPPTAHTLDFSAQWRPQRNLRVNLAVVNLTDRRYWNWSDVQGLAGNASPLVVDAYTQSGRHLNLSVVRTF